MRIKYLQHRWGGETSKPGGYANRRAGTTVEPLTGREGKLANTSWEKEEMLWHEWFPPYANDQYYQPPHAGSGHIPVTEHSVEWAL